MQDGHHAHGLGAVHSHRCVVDEHDAPGFYSQSLTSQSVNARIGFLHYHLMRVDDVIDKTPIPGRALLALPRTDQAVAEQSGAKARPQSPQEVDHRLVRRSQVLLPHVIKQLVDSGLINRQPLRETLSQLSLVDRTNIAR